MIAGAVSLNTIAGFGTASGLQVCVYRGGIESRHVQNSMDSDEEDSRAS